ncbi:ABC transporter ATP-binding protein [Lentzea terrae]|uniref:ABC transporter ATP-binding protein n=1 Tax=Lentzea terrae TaxID=2200761 RepID=UPI000DD30086|nr:ABC transporter ATP-binding protein [Lentzea terrae]
MNAIRVRGLTKAYKGHQAVAGVDLDVARGEVFAVLGPNGAGKTTSVEILEGHRDRDGGEVSVLGVDPAEAGREWRSRLGIVLQSATDAATLTVREAVQHYARYYADPRDPEEIIDLVGLTEKAKARAGTLSGGQRRRLDVALGIIGRPELVFLDEPTTGFDPEARRQFWGLIKLLAAEGTTILLTTHYLDEAEALADRVAVLAGGRIVAEGTPRTLGGRAHADATVRWLSDRGYTEIRTSEPTKAIAELSRNGELAELTVTRPSLEDVYLELIK